MHLFWYLFAPSYFVDWEEGEFLFCFRKFSLTPGYAGGSLECFTASRGCEPRKLTSLRYNSRFLFVRDVRTVWCMVLLIKARSTSGWKILAHLMYKARDCMMTEGSWLTLFSWPIHLAQIQVSVRLKSFPCQITWCCVLLNPLFVLRVFGSGPSSWSN